MHSGDLAHGEDVNLDDSSWETIKPRDNAPKDAVWFRQTVQVPDTLNGYDLTGSRIWFQFHAEANGPMPEILYFNGRRVAMGDDLEPIVLFDSAKPGDKVTVAVKLLQPSTPRASTAQPIASNSPKAAPIPKTCALSFSPPHCSFRRSPRTTPARWPPSTSRIQHCGHFGPRCPRPGQVRRQPQGLDSDKLDAFRPLLQQATFHLTGNSHIDAAWLWPWTETVDVVKRTFGTALQLMYEYPQYTYTQSAAPTTSGWPTSIPT